MLHVKMLLAGENICEMRVSRMNPDLDLEVEDYVVRVFVHRGGDVYGSHRRVLKNFPRKALNSLALLKASLELFDIETFGLENNDDSKLYRADEPTIGTSDLERTERRALPSVPSEEES